MNIIKIFLLKRKLKKLKKQKLQCSQLFSMAKFCDNYEVMNELKKEYANFEKEIESINNALK